MNTERAIEYFKNEVRFGERAPAGNIAQQNVDWVMILEANKAALAALREKQERENHAADVVEVVRCKDCKSSNYCEEIVRCSHPYGLTICDGNDFCSYGERRKQEPHIVPEGWREDVKYGEGNIGLDGCGHPLGEPLGDNGDGRIAAETAKRAGWSG